MPNGVACGAIEHKMGIKASATCVMNFDGAVGHLVGEPHKGMRAMFTLHERRPAPCRHPRPAPPRRRARAVQSARERL